MHEFNGQSLALLWVKMAVYPTATGTGEPAELKAIGDGFANPASARAVEQSRGFAATVIESFVNRIGPDDGWITVHS